MKPFNSCVEIEEPIYGYSPFKNGASPLGCHGNTCIVRHGENVFVSGTETLRGLEPLNNTRWMLFRRDANGWQLLQKDDEGRQREPCPIGIFADGRLWLSNNPTLTLPNTFEGPSNPHLLQLDARNPTAPPRTLQPQWLFNPGFNEHSYRAMGVDRVNGEIAVFNNFGYEQQHWAFLDRNGVWANRGVIRYPQRGCYENVALRDGVCQVQAVGDVAEPNQEWAQWKKSNGHRGEWDFVFRRLFYTRNLEIGTQQFSAPIEIDNVDATAGIVRNVDFYVDKDGAAHSLYFKQTVEIPEMRDVFFPGAPLLASLEYAIIRENEVVGRKALLQLELHGNGDTPDWARFQATPDGRLFVFAVTKSKTPGIFKNRLFEILPNGKITPPIKITLQKPLTAFMTANERGGSAPSNYLDIYGSANTDFLSDEDDEMRYVRIRLA
jgi:hypothetical protein